jgi:hypothetical protein
VTLLNQVPIGGLFRWVSRPYEDTCYCLMRATRHSTHNDVFVEAARVCKRCIRINNGRSGSGQCWYTGYSRVHYDPLALELEDRFADARP